MIFSPHKANGFTILELVATIAVLAIVIGIATPAMGAFVDNAKVRSFSDQLKSDLRLTRFEANKSGMRTTLCASSNHAQCTGSFSEGWIAFHDANANGSVDAGENVFLTSGAVESGVNADILANDGSSVTSMTYNYRGFLNQELSASVTRHGSHQLLALSLSGRVAEL